jgi:hypothetical protein
VLSFVASTLVTVLRWVAACDAAQVVWLQVTVLQQR